MLHGQVSEKPPDLYDVVLSRADSCYVFSKRELIVNHNPQTCLCPVPDPDGRCLEGWSELEVSRREHSQYCSSYEQ